MRVVVTGGGTGGHIYPALAVAQAMQALPDVEAVTYIGKTDGLESELVPQAGIAFDGIAFYGMPRGKNPLLPFKLLQWGLKLREARQIAIDKLKTLQPDVVFGTGGYVSAPVLLAAQVLKIPYVLHEPDAQPGLANRFMAKGAQVITTSFSEGAERLKQHPQQRVLVTGNPIRGSIGTTSKTEALTNLGLGWPADQRVLLVTGGSQGARRLNSAVVEALPTLLNDLNLAVIHLTGKKLYDETCDALAKLPWPDTSPSQVVQPEALDESASFHPNYRVYPYAANMDALLALADVALCRAGSLSLSEMYVCGIPTLLVPYPFAASDHQRKNAQASVRTGASVMVEDRDCTAARITDTLQQLVNTPGQLTVMREAALRLGHPQATADIVACLQGFGKSD